MERSRLILGTVQFGMRYGIANTHGQPTQQEVDAIIAAAAEGGIRLLDTSSDYGESEKVLGRALKATGLGGTMEVVSKVERVPAGLSPEAAREHIRASLDKSLENLGLDCLYAMLFHHEADCAYYPILQEFVAEGKIRHAGCSLDGGLPDNIVDIHTVQVPGNILDRRFLAYLREAHRNGTEIYNRSVYLQGMLLMPEEKIPPHLAELVPIRRRLETLAARLGIAPAELYMRYLLSIPEIDGVLTGVDTLEQLQQNMALAARGPLPEDVMAEILAIVPELPERLIRPSIWGRKG